MSSRRSEHRSFPLMLIGTTALIILSFTLINMLDIRPSANAPSSAYPAPVTSGLPTTPPETRCAQWFSEKDKLPTDSPKRIISEKDYEGCVAAWQSPLPPPNAKRLPEITSAPPVSAGIAERAAGAGIILEIGMGTLPAMAYVIVNMWYQETGDKRIRVFAGAKRDNPGGAPGASQGVVVVMVETLDHQTLPQEGGEYPTPTKAGAVRIVDGNGMQLTLVAENGEAFFFNVASKQFVSPGPKSPVERSAGKGIILESRVISLPTDNYSVENQWYEEAGDERITVLAGSELQNYKQGVLVVIVTSLSQPATILKKETYLTLLLFGPTRVVEVDGEQLVLATSEGGRFVFDLPSRQFISWPEVPPDITLQPTGDVAVATVTVPAIVLPPTPTLAPLPTAYPS